MSLVEDGGGTYIVAERIAGEGLLESVLDSGEGILDPLLFVLTEQVQCLEGGGCGVDGTLLANASSKEAIALVQEGLDVCGVVGGVGGLVVEAGDGYKGVSVWRR